MENENRGKGNLGRARGGCAGCLYTSGGWSRAINQSLTQRHRRKMGASNFWGATFPRRTCRTLERWPELPTLNIAWNLYEPFLPGFMGPDDGRVWRLSHIVGGACLAVSAVPATLPALSLFGLLQESQKPKWSACDAFYDWPVQQQLIHFVSLTPQPCAGQFRCTLIASSLTSPTRSTRFTSLSSPPFSFLWPSHTKRVLELESPDQPLHQSRLF